MIIISKKIIFAFFLCLSLALNIFLFAISQINRYSFEQKYEEAEFNVDLLSFTNMFIEKILMADGEIDFETRLALETAVRNLDDKDIFAQWQEFTESETRETASQQAKKLLNLLIKNLRD